MSNPRAISGPRTLGQVLACASVAVSVVLFAGLLLLAAVPMAVVMMLTRPRWSARGLAAANSEGVGNGTPHRSRGPVSE